MTDDNGSPRGPFGLDPEDFDRLAREAGEGLREAVGKLFEAQGGSGAWTGMFESATRRTRSQPRPEPQPHPETTGETGTGVWAIVMVEDGGGARVEQVYATEIEALRANKHNVDAARKVRFLPYGIAVAALDEEDGTAGHA